MECQANDSQLRKTLGSPSLGNVFLPGFWLLFLPTLQAPCSWLCYRLWRVERNSVERLGRLRPIAKPATIAMPATAPVANQKRRDNTHSFASSCCSRSIADCKRPVASRASMVRACAHIGPVWAIAVALKSLRRPKPPAWPAKLLPSPDQLRGEGMWREPGAIAVSTASTACSNSVGSAKRSTGRLHSNRSIMSLKPTGTSGRTCAIGTGSSLMCAKATAKLVAPKNGGRPASKW